MNSRGIEEWWENGGKSGDVGKSLNDLKSLALACTHTIPLSPTARL